MKHSLGVAFVNIYVGLFVRNFETHKCTARHGVRLTATVGIRFFLFIYLYGLPTNIKLYISARLFYNADTSSGTFLIARENPNVLVAEGSLYQKFSRIFFKLELH